MTWNKLSNLLRAYETLFLTDQVFLVEALEHVQFGQLSAAANVVQKLTRDSLDPQHKYGASYQVVNFSPPPLSVSLKPFNDLVSCRPESLDPQHKYVASLLPFKGGGGAAF